VFTREAVQVISERSCGIPRTINVIADNVLLGGFAAQQRPVRSGIVREICRDFDIRATDALKNQASHVLETEPQGNGNGAGDTPKGARAVPHAGLRRLAVWREQWRSR
jgi:hypothetical protein